MIARRIICYCNNGLYCVLLMSVWVKAGQWEGRGGVRRGLWIGKKCATLEASKSFYVLLINSQHPSLCLTQESSFKSLITFYTHCLYWWQRNVIPHICAIIKSRRMEIVVDTAKNIAVQTGRDDISVIILLQFKCHKTPQKWKQK